MMTTKRAVTLVFCILCFAILMGVRDSMSSPISRILTAAVAGAVLGFGINLRRDKP